MTVSVIIPTFNGAHRIHQLMLALTKQSCQPHEVVVVIDGSKDDTETVLHHFSRQLPLIVKSIANAGRSIARNTGVKASSGDLLVFYDDDMEPNDNSVEAHVEFHKKNQGIVTGNLGEIFSSDKPDIQNYKAWLSKIWTKKYADGLNLLNHSDLFFTTANCSFKRSDFNTLGGFNELLTDAEDYELALRALQAGLPVYFDKSNYAIHHDLITCQSYIKRQGEYKRAIIQVLQLNPEAVPKITPKPTAFKHFIYTILSLPVFPKLIDRFNIFLLLPKSLRYTCYSAVIHAHSQQ
jgi:glycosyltransferase involved in cell wall biosynthesis